MSSTLRALQSRCKSPGHRNQGYLRKTVRNALSAGKSAGGALACWRERFSWEQAASITAMSEARYERDCCPWQPWHTSFPSAALRSAESVDSHTPEFARTMPVLRHR
jgi:hypothetical protein